MKEEMSLVEEEIEDGGELRERLESRYDNEDDCVQESSTSKTFYHKKLDYTGFSPDSKSK